MKINFQNATYTYHHYEKTRRITNVSFINFTDNLIGKLVPHITVMHAIYLTMPALRVYNSTEETQTLLLSKSSMIKHVNRSHFIDHTTAMLGLLYSNN